MNPGRMNPGRRSPGRSGSGRYEPPAPRRTDSVESADGTWLHYEEHGPEQAPTVLLSHGWTCSTLFWAPVVRELAADHRVVLYDQRGHGRSAVPQAGGYSTRALADDLAAVAEHALPAGQRAVFAGHSMGGMTLMAAADRPAVRDRAAAVLLASTGSSHLVRDAAVLPERLGGPRLRDAFHRYLLHSPLPLGPQTAISRAALKYAVLSPGATREQVAATARVVHACRPRVRAGWGAVLSSLDLDRGVAVLTAPTAVLVGTGDRLTPPRHARELAERLPNCIGLTELPGLGHMTPTEAPEQVAELIRRLVRDHLAAVPADTAETAGAARPAPQTESKEGSPA